MGGAQAIAECWRNLTAVGARPLATTDCMNFGNPNNDAYAFVPDYAEQQSDSTANINKQVVEMKGKVIELNGVKYSYRRLNKQVLELYDYKSYKEAEKDPDVMPVIVGTYEVNESKQAVLKLIGAT